MMSCAFCGAEEKKHSLIYIYIGLWGVIWNFRGAGGQHLLPILVIWTANYFRQKKENIKRFGEEHIIIFGEKAMSTKHYQLIANFILKS